MADKITLNDDEFAKLIELADRDHPVQAGFGPGGVRLEVFEDHSRNWAMYLVAIWRGLELSETDKVHARMIVEYWETLSASATQGAPPELIEAVA